MPNHKKEGLPSNNKKKAEPPGKLIVFEGLDGAGKSTQIARLGESLRKRGRKVHLTAEPTDSVTGGLLRDVLSGNDRRTPAEFAALFLADRIAHNQNPIWGFQRFLTEGFDVLCDRYYYSTFAYQGLKTNLDWLFAMHFGCPDILRPDLCLFLDVPPLLCKKRLDETRTNFEIFEHNASDLQDIRTNFLKVFALLESRETVRIVDASGLPEDAAKEILEHTLSIL